MKFTHHAVGSLALAALVVGAAACGDDKTEEPFTVAPPAQGVQYLLESRLAPFQETERCMFIKVPVAGMNIVKDDIRYNAGSHHVLAWMTPYKEIPTKGRNGQDIDTSGVFDCSNGPGDDFDLTGIVAGTQSNEGGFARGLPEGVAVKVKGGSVLLLDVHYVNTSGATIDTRTFFNLHTIADEDVVTEAGILFLYNFFIAVPGQGESSAAMRCPVPSDVTLVSGQSHMHQTGVGFLAETVAADGTRTELYRETDWDEPHLQIYADGAGTVLKAGTSLSWNCDYKNNSADDIFQGGSSKDEMCMFLGTYYPRVPELEYCSPAADPTAWMTEAIVEPTGTKTGAETLACLSSVKKQEDSFSCVVASCAGVAKPLTALLNAATTIGKQCKDVCAVPASTECRTCANAVNADLGGALATASCGE